MTQKGFLLCVLLTFSPSAYAALMHYDNLCRYWRNQTPLSAKGHDPPRVMFELLTVLAVNRMPWILSHICDMSTSENWSTEIQPANQRTEFEIGFYEELLLESWKIIPTFFTHDMLPSALIYWFIEDLYLFWPATYPNHGIQSEQQQAGITRLLSAGPNVCFFCDCHHPLTL